MYCIDMVYDNVYDNVYVWYCLQYAESGGIPLSLLKRKLNEAGISEQLPPHKVDMLIRKADEDLNGYLDYEEFIELVSCVFPDKILLIQFMHNSAQKLMPNAWEQMSEVDFKYLLRHQRWRYKTGI